MLSPNEKTEKTVYRQHTQEKTEKIFLMMILHQVQPADICAPKCLQEVSKTGHCWESCAQIKCLLL